MYGFGALFLLEESQMKSVARSRVFSRLAALAVVAVVSVVSLTLDRINAAPASFFGAIYTSLGDGTTVNQNLYAQKSDVYLNGGPQNENSQGLPDGTYY